MRRGVIEMLAGPAIGGVIVAGLAVGHVHPDRLWRWLIAALFIAPALLAQGRYTKRHGDDPWPTALTLLITGTVLMIAIAWAAGLMAALTMAAAWVFFHDEAVMNQVVATVIVATAGLHVLARAWRWLDAPTNAGRADKLEGVT